MEVCDEIRDGCKILVVCSPFEAPSACSSHSPSPPRERKNTSIETFEREESGVKLKREELPVYFSQAL